MIKSKDIKKEKMLNDDSFLNLFNYLIYYSIFHLVLGIISIYLSFKCNEGFKLLNILIAFFTAPIYILYQLINNFKKCFPK